MSKYQNQKEKGFTLIELLIVIGILAVLLAITIIAINPARQFAKANNAAKYNAANAMLNAISQCFAENKGTFTGPCAAVNNVTTGATDEFQICRGAAASGGCDSAFAASSVDLCGLVNNASAAYIAELPRDPKDATSQGTGSAWGLPGLCASGATAAYNTKLKIKRSSLGKITIIAIPDSNDPSISSIEVAR